MNEVFVPAAKVRPEPPFARHIFVADGWLLCRDGDFLHRGNRFPGGAIGSSHYLGELGGEPVGVHALATQAEVPGCEWRGLRNLLGRVDESLFALAGRAVQVVNWDSDHRFCGRCGSPTDYHASERARECPRCHLTAYPRISPCVIMLVIKGEECLLARHTHHRHRLFTALAGFVEPGESAEQALVREVAEEVSVEVGPVQYVASQSWPFPGQLMLGYLAHWAGGDIRVDGEEIAEADWFHYRALPEVPPAETLSGRLIRTFAEIAARGAG
ncbi:NAD(+) diphosphatase [Microbulbifer sp. TYP-18]|uniref:NAD(+) diphosphatase n=1 Tax=Microbulbifer sp. TYP-18 TaxID=3230024 RepID=UPI0034C5B61F